MAQARSVLHHRNPDSEDPVCHCDGDVGHAGAVYHHSDQDGDCADDGGPAGHLYFEAILFHSLYYTVSVSHAASSVYLTGCQVS